MIQWIEYSEVQNIVPPPYPFKNIQKRGVWYSLNHFKLSLLFVFKNFHFYIHFKGRTILPCSVLGVLNWTILVGLTFYYSELYFTHLNITFIDGKGMKGSLKNYKIFFQTTWEMKTFRRHPSRTCLCPSPTVAILALVLLSFYQLYLHFFSDRS